MTQLEPTRKTPNFSTDAALSELNGGFLKVILFVLAFYLLARMLFGGGDPVRVNLYFWILPFLFIVSTPLIYLFLLAVFFLGGFSAVTPKRRWLKRAVHTKAIVVDKRMNKHVEYGYDYSYEYYVPELKLKYVAGLAISSPREQVVWASISPSIYEKYQLHDTVDIFYSNTDPSLLLIEGE